MKKILSIICCLLMIVNACAFTVAGIMPTDVVSADTTPTTHATVNLTINYYRYAKDYDGWNVWMWTKAAPDATVNSWDPAKGQTFEEGTTDDGFKQMKLTLSSANGKWKSTDYIGFIIRLGEWTEREPGGDRYIDPSYIDADGNLSVWIMEGDTTIYYDRSAIDMEPRMRSATLDSVNQISFTANHFFEEDFAATVKVINSNGEEVTGGVVTADIGKMSGTIAFATPLDLANTYIVYSTQHLTTGTEPVDKGAYVSLVGVLTTDAFADQFTYTGDDLGAVYTSASTTFKVWAPLASDVKLVLYRDGNTASEIGTPISMTKGEKGVWSYTYSGDAKNIYYVYQVTNFGNMQEATDPYAKAVGVNGKRAMVVDLGSTNPDGWDSYTRPQFSVREALLYEVHIRDFTIGANSGVSQANKGKYLGMVERGTTNSHGQATGIDHILELGVNTVHLMPSFDFSSNSIDETNLDTPQFNWGYDPQNYNVPEGSYSSNPYDGNVRISEYKQMVKGFHDNGIKVVMDVVYNHTFDSDSSNFSKIVPNYFYRMTAAGGYSNGSGCGNETASERSMMRKYMVDSVVYWATEYHIDGFRFDLMGLHDIVTMNAISEALHQVNPDIIIYGEGWDAGGSALPVKDAALKRNTAELDNIAAFSDNIRDGLKGHVFTATAKGFVNGGAGFEENVKFGIVGSVNHPGVDITAVQWNSPQEFWALSPLQAISYASAHDNYTLWDKLSISNPTDTEEDRIKMNNLAASVVYLSQGTPFMLSGEELLRTKPNAELATGLDENSYKSSDAVNAIDWDRKDTYSDVFNYYKGLIEFRKANMDMFKSTANAVRVSLQFLPTDDGVVAYTVKAGKSTMLVIHNATTEAVNFAVPDGNYKVYVSGNTSGKTSEQAVSGSVSVGAISTVVVADIAGGGLSTGAIIGIAAGGVAVVGGGVTTAVLLIRKRKATVV